MSTPCAGVPSDGRLCLAPWSPPASALAGDIIVGDDVPTPRRASGSVTIFAGTIYLGQLLGIVTGPIAARSLGTSGRGEYAAVTNYDAISTVVLALGMSLSATYSIAKLRRTPAEVLGTSMRYAAAISPLAILFAWVLPEFALTNLSHTARVATAVVIGLTPLSILQLCAQGIFIGEGKLGDLAKLRLAPLLISAAGTLALALAGALTVRSYLILYVTNSLLTSVLTLTLLGLRPASGGALRPALRFGLRSYPGSLANYTNASVDQALIAPVISSSALGLYSVAVTVSNLPLGILQAISAGSVRAIRSSDGPLRFDVAAAIVRRSVVIGTILMAGLLVAIPVGIPLLYGRPFHGAVILGIVLALGVVALGASTVLGPFVQLAGGPGLNSMAEVVAVVFTVVGLTVLLPLVGVLGASITSVVAYWVRCLIQAFAFRRLTGESFVPRMTDVRQVGKSTCAVGSRLTRRRCAS